MMTLKAHEAVAHQIKSPEENPRLCSSRSWRVVMFSWDLLHRMKKKKKKRKTFSRGSSRVLTALTPPDWFLLICLSQ